MKRLEFTKQHDLSQLHDELIAAIPVLRPVPADHPGLINALQAVITVESAGDNITLTVPDNANEQEVEQVVKAHVPKPPPPPPPTRAELRDRLKKAKTTDDLKSVIDSVIDRLT